MFKIFRDYTNLITTISEKKDGPMKFSEKNREKFLEKLGIDNKLIVRAGLVHGNEIKIVSGRDAGRMMGKRDGLITADKNLFLTITVADCLPIFLYDPEKGVVGLIHAGWRNLAKDILGVAIGKMIKNFGSLPEDILVGIGPGISQCHFEVKEDLLREFEILHCKRPLQKSSDRTIFAMSPLAGALLEKNGKNFLDLKKIAKIQLIDLGIKDENIEINPECTFCLPEKYFSFRREKPEKPQTMIALIGKR